LRPLFRSKKQVTESLPVTDWLPANASLQEKASLRVISPVTMLETLQRWETAMLPAAA
jgi:hypothetical protein